MSLTQCVIMHHLLIIYKFDRHKDELGNIEQLLGGRSFEDYLEIFDSMSTYTPDANPEQTEWFDTLQQIEEECNDDARTLAKALGLGLHEGKPGKFECSASNLMFLTYLNPMVAVENIKDSLKNRHLVAATDKHGSFRLLMPMMVKTEKEYCIGSGTVKQGLEPQDYARFMVSDGWFLVEMYPRVTKPENMLVLDMNAKGSCTKGRSKKKQVETPLGVALPILDTNREVRNCTVHLDSAQSRLTTFRVGIRRPGGEGHNSYHIHQLINTVSAGKGYGLSKFAPLRKYLGLTEDCEGWEDVPRFTYYQKNDPESSEAIQRRSEKLKKRGWEDVKTARWSDMDHLVGRSQFWMNSNIFIMCCSHQWNQQKARTRIFFGEWLYMMALIEYGTGND